MICSFRAILAWKSDDDDAAADADADADDDDDYDDDYKSDPYMSPSYAGDTKKIGIHRSCNCEITAKYFARLNFSLCTEHLEDKWIERNLVDCAAK